MNISALFIRRPVLSTVFALLILLIGFQGIFNLAVREYPEVEETVITVTTVYPGASPELIQGFVTSPIAAAVARLDPQAAENPADAPTVATARPPRQCPNHARAASNISRLMPDAMAKWPMRMNRGIAMKR